ncbi:MAG: hypothetical protein WBA29_13555 [Xanthobacteraceae bacterium]
MRPSDLVDSQDRPISLGAVLGKGGEGTVFELSQTAAIVAKVYHKPLTRDRADKIKAMSAIRTDALSKLTSWPLDLVRTRTTGQPIGLLMPRVSNRKNIHHLYGPKSRLQDFPKADWRFLVRAAANTARAFAVVHDAGCVVGDVNHGSIMVAEDATVCLIDCDSFQVSALGRQFLCEVGIETFTPPELQGLPFRGVLRTPNYDNFGLAVMIFHLLFMGRHPFAGRFSGAGDMPIARAIKECRFPYSVNHKAMQMDPPPGTPPLSFVSTDVAHLFEAAFSQAAIKGGRPTARAWVSALQTLENNTKRCGANPGHWHPAQLPQCPWCRMETQGANPLFPYVVPLASGSSGPTLDLDALWRQLAGLPMLGPAPTIPAPQVAPSQAARKLGNPGKVASPIALILGAGAFLAGTVMIPQLFFIWAIIAVVAYNIALKTLGKTEEVRRFKEAMNSADANFKQAEADWRNRAGDQAFEEAKRKFTELKNELAQIPAKRNRALDQLKQSQRKLQLDRFLDRFDLEDAKIEGIGPGRKRTLESYGIETAEDILSHRISAVPGFGPKMIDRLMKWRRSIEAKFVFDPAKAIDPRDIAKVEQDILLLRSKTENSAKAAHGEAMQAHARIAAIRQTLRPQLDALQAASAQARIDYEFVS